MKAYLVFEDKDGEEVKRITLEDRGESQNYQKFGSGKFDRKNGSDPVVVSVYYDLDEYAQLMADVGEAEESE